MDEPCMLCGAPAVHAHHPTGRPTPEGPYLDPGFVVPVCRSCHHVEHAAWRDIGIDVIADPILARLLRLTWLVGRLVDLNRADSLTAEALRGFHRCLVEIASSAART
jgi:hypothetical protein